MSSHSLTVFGNAGQKVVATININSSDLELTLMDFLRNNGIPVASSCLGEGVCRKCVVKSENGEILSCLIPVKTFLEKNKAEISISYL